MYINKVDDLLDRIVDDFYTVVVLKEKKLDKIKEEVNFIKFQKDLNEAITKYIKTIPASEITDIVKKGDSYNTIHETIQKYIVIYVFLYLGFFYKGKSEGYINNIIEFSRNQSEYSLKLPNFFNSESNSLIIKLFYICRNVSTLLTKDSIKIEYIRREPYAQDTIDFLNSLNDEFISAAFRLKALDGNVSNQAHNIIKTIIILLVYKISDKKTLYNIIETVEMSDGEYMFIDIVEPIVDVINFNSIESLLSKKDLLSGLAYDIWDYMGEMDDMNKKILSNEDKINILINSGIIVPILDDFLLYHRDNERYDKISESGAVKKKEDTKVRYIIGKIDSTAELYSDAANKDTKLKGNIMKNFSVPLYNKKAILRNNNEEIKIINKFINQGKRNIENNDFFNDLIGYRRYAYINFKDFDKSGFSNHFTKTVTAVRAVNFDLTSEFRQTNTDQKLQLRVGARDTIGNIVGFMIPSNNQSIKCIKISDTINIRDLGGRKKNKNGFNLFMSFLKRSIIKKEKHNSSVYWLFDPQYDIVKIDNVVTKEHMSPQDLIKGMVSELYNHVISQIYIEIIERIDIHNDITIDKALKIVKFIEKTILGVPLSSEMYEDVEKYLFEKKLKILTDPELPGGDLLYGLEGDTIQLPTYQSPGKPLVKTITIDLAHVDESGNIIEDVMIDGICQHNITWDNLSKIKRDDYAEYMRQLYLFIQQYVIENTSQDYVCRSCGFYLDIKKYIQEGVFDDEKGFITFSMPMETNLEDMPEYEKLQFSIKIMDKNIEKIASSVGIPYFVGNATPIKWRRKSIIKNAIDMVTSNNQLLMKNFKERNEIKTKLYGVSKALSSLFVFDMENNIFQTSSKDKDQEQFKIIKRNNIITYIMIFIILELNESQISFFVTDKKNMCDIRIFDKVYTSLFAGLRLKRNNANDTVDITKYKMLCYLIYMISCRIAKHRLWGSLQATEKNIQKMIPNTQRYIVHTAVDIINSILENSYQSGVSYIFEIFRARFLSKLNTLFNNNEYYNILLSQNKLSFVTAKKRAHLKLIPNDVVIPYTYEPVQWRTVIPVRFFPPILKRIEYNLNGISNLSNCPDGQFHKWKFENGVLVCTLCKAVMRDIKYSQSETDKIIEKFTLERLNLLAVKICQVDGELHQYAYDSTSGQYICLKCKKPDNYRYSTDELHNIDKVIDKINSYRRARYQTIVDTYHIMDETEKHNIMDVVDRYRTNFVKSINRDSPFKYIDDFMDLLQTLIGNEVKGEYPINLKNNTYIIDHDHNGHDLAGKIILISESDNKISYKADHPHFKTDVLYYTDKSISRIDVFYDLITRRLIGYKEASRDYVDIINTDKKIKINYSIQNKLKLLGYSSEYINIDDDYSFIKDTYIKPKKFDPFVEENTKGFAYTSDLSSVEPNILQNMFKEIVGDICSNRINNLKQILLEFQRLFNRIINGFENDFEDYSNNNDYAVRNIDKNSRYDKENPSYFGDKMNNLVDKYKKKLRNIIVSNNSKNMVFVDWKGITQGIYPENFSDKYFNFQTDLIDVMTISRYDSQSNLILYFLLHEFTKLINYNVNYMKTNICHFIIEFIDKIFSKYNTDHLHTNNDIKRFLIIIKSPGFIKETDEQTKDDSNINQGFYEEYVDTESDLTPEEIDRQADKLLDDREEQDALDIDMEIGDMEEGVTSKYDDQAEIDYDYEAQWINVE